MSQQVMTPTTDLNSPMTLIPNFTSNEFTTDEQLSLISRIAVASIGSQGTVGGLIITGIVIEYFHQISLLIIISNYFHSCSRQSAGVFLLLLVEFTCQCTLMRDSHGQIKQKRESSRNNMLNMQLVNSNLLLILHQQIVVIKCNSEFN